ncbi:MAG: ATP-binding protein [Acidobacteriota bacterium]|nr:ATP-binding protein [Acidobacteriota bacterium]
MSDETPAAGNPPKDIWEVNQRLQFDEPLAPGDDRWVDTADARGEFSFSPLYRSLGVDPRTWELKGPPRKSYILFCGHRGCGKSTELRRVHWRLNRKEKFLAVLLDAAKALDPNNLQYQDVLLALAEALLARLAEHQIDLDPVHLTLLRQWFDERIEKHEATRQFAAEVKSGAKAEGGIPFLSKIFAELTAAFRVNSTYKEELRRVVRNHFTEFARAFNQLILAAEDACSEHGLGKRVLFLVDGTDRLRGDDADSFFVRDVYQLQLVEALFVYSAPIHLLHGGGAIHQSFTVTFKLPMIKLQEKDGASNPVALRAMEEILFRRAPRELFDDPSTADYLIEHSGGHPRDLLRLLQYSFEHAREDLFDRPAAERAVKALATDYRQFLDAEDYALLRQIDEQPQVERNSEQARRLLYNLALLEYNAYWWRSHPVVRTLDAYREAGRS